MTWLYCFIWNSSPGDPIKISTLDHCHFLAFFDPGAQTRRAIPSPPCILWLILPEPGRRRRCRAMTWFLHRRHCRSNLHQTSHALYYQKQNRQLIVTKEKSFHLGFRQENPRYSDRPSSIFCTTSQDCTMPWKDHLKWDDHLKFKVTLGLRRFTIHESIHDSKSKFLLILNHFRVEVIHYSWIDSWLKITIFTDFESL